MPLTEEGKKKKTQRQIKFNRERTTRIAISLNNNTDADIIAYLQSLPNKQGLFKELIRERMTKEGFACEPDAKL